ncbi:MAG: GNAT family N-acetyltransferase [Deltaproteobacteria bacterium]
MLVNDWMSSPVITVDVQENMHRAVDLMTEHKIGMLPVLENGKLVGIVTDRDLKQAAPSSVAVFEISQILYHLTRVKMESIMTRNPITVRPDLTIEEAADVLRSNNISGCPVLDKQGDLAGIITKNDIFRALTSVIGMPGRGLQMGFMVEDRPGSIKEVTDVIRSFGARLVSIVSSYEKAPEGFRYLHVRTFNIGGIFAIPFSRWPSEASYPRQYEKTMLTKDGMAIFLRPIKPEDGALLVKFFNTLSPETIFFRFLSHLKTLPSEWVEHFTQIDYDREVAMIAVEQSDAEERILGVCRIMRSSGSTRGEAAVVVGDQWQGRGIGSLLLKECLRIAKELGMRTVWGLFDAENKKALRLAGKFGFAPKTHPELGTTELEMSLK